MVKKIRQAIIPAAGLGTRFLPVTKTVPKELLPLAEKPCIQHVIDEGILAGIEEFIIVISKEKAILEDYFKPNPHLNKWLLAKNKKEIYEEIQAIESKAKFKFVYQDEPLGLGHAVLCGQAHITDDHFFVLLPDDIIDSQIPVCKQMIDIFHAEPHPLVAVMAVGWDNVHQYGIVKANPLSDKLGVIQNIIEKPKREQAPSNLAVIGRYLLPTSIFKILQQVQPGAGGEIQLTDALKQLISSQSIHSYSFVGERYDTGNPLGLLQANLSVGLRNQNMKEQLQSFIKVLAGSY